MDIKTKAKYEKYLILYAEEKDVLKTAHEDGIQKGIQKGIKKGIKSSIIAMLNEGLELNLIAKILQLSLSDIELINQERLAKI